MFTESDEIATKDYNIYARSVEAHYHGCIRSHTQAMMAMASAIADEMTTSVLQTVRL